MIRYLNEKYKDVYKEIELMLKGNENVIEYYSYIDNECDIEDFCVKVTVSGLSYEERRKLTDNIFKMASDKYQIRRVEVGVHATEGLDEMCKLAYTEIASMLSENENVAYYSQDVDTEYTGRDLYIKVGTPGLSAEGRDNLRDEIIGMAKERCLSAMVIVHSGEVRNKPLFRKAREILELAEEAYNINKTEESARTYKESKGNYDFANVYRDYTYVMDEVKGDRLMYGYGHKIKEIIVYEREEIYFEEGQLNGYDTYKEVRLETSKHYQGY